MASTNTSQPQLLSVEQLTSIRANHSPTADAIQKIVNYINKNVKPVPGNKVAPR